MAQTLLDMMQSVCLEIGLPVPTAVVTTQDDQVKQLLALANREGREQVSAAGGWSQLKGEQLITLVNGQAAYDFPTDFDSYMPSTIWNRDQRWPVAGPLTPQEWQFVKSGLINAQPWQRYRVMDGQLFIDPIPTPASTGQTIVIEYQSKAFCASAAGVKQTQWLGDTDTYLLPEDVLTLGVKWRFLAAKRMNYAQERKDWQDCVDRELARSTVGRTLSLNLHEANNFLGDGNWGNLPDGNFPGRV
jgi:hypothetical protein